MLIFKWAIVDLTMAIVLVDRINQLINGRYAVQQAIIEACLNSGKTHI